MIICLIQLCVYLIFSRILLAEIEDGFGYLLLVCRLCLVCIYFGFFGDDLCVVCYGHLKSMNCLIFGSRLLSLTHASFGADTCSIQLSIISFLVDLRYKMLGLVTFSARALFMLV